MSRRLFPALILAACSTEVDVLPEATFTPVAPTQLGSATQQGRSWRRMDIDQLDASLRRVTGVGWTERVDGRTVDLFERLSGSLGKPDYLSSTEEDLTPGLLFQKFLGDAALVTCTELVRQDRTGSADTRRLLRRSDPDATLATSRAAIEADVSDALLLYHGTVAPPGSAALEPWMWLWSSVAEDTDSTDAAWRSLCVALILHPAFTAY